MRKWWGIVAAPRISKHGIEGTGGNKRVRQDSVLSSQGKL